MVCIVCVLTSTLWLLDIVTLCYVRHLMSLIVFIHFNSPSSWWCVCSYADSGVWLIHLIHYMQVGAGYCNAQLKMFRALTKKKSICAATGSVICITTRLCLSLRVSTHLQSLEGISADYSCPLTRTCFFLLPARQADSKQSLIERFYMKQTFRKPLLIMTPVAAMWTVVSNMTVTLF